MTTTDPWKKGEIRQQNPPSLPSCPSYETCGCPLVLPSPSPSCLGEKLEALRPMFIAETLQPLSHLIYMHFLSFHIIWVFSYFIFTFRSFHIDKGGLNRIKNIDTEKNCKTKTPPGYKIKFTHNCKGHLVSHFPFTLHESESLTKLFCILIS